MGEERISVVVPVYNARHVLGRCLLSLLEQRPGEILLVDDGSTDESGMFCDEMAAAHPEIRVLHQENAGVSAARNAGLRLAVYEWVTFMDADDLLLPGAIPALLRAANGADAVCGGVKRGVDAVPGDGPDRCLRTPEELRAALRLVLENPTRYLTCHGWIFRTERIRGLTFRTDLHYGEDSELLVRILPLCRAIVLSGREVYGYTIQKQSALHGYHAQTQSEYLRTLAAVEKELSDQPDLVPSLALYELIHLLLILTHGTFHPSNPAPVRETWRLARELCASPRFRRAFANAPLERLGTARRVALELLKRGWIAAAWVCVRVRQAYNARQAE